MSWRMKYHALGFISLISILQKSNIEQGEQHYRHQIHQPRTTIIANGHQEGHIGEYQIMVNAPITRERGNENFLKISTKHFLFGLCCCACAQVIELNLAHTHVLWSYLYVLVLTDILQALLKTHHGLRNDARPYRQNRKHARW